MLEFVIGVVATVGASMVFPEQYSMFLSRVSDLWAKFKSDDDKQSKWYSSPLSTILRQANELSIIECKNN